MDVNAWIGIAAILLVLVGGLSLLFFFTDKDGVTRGGPLAQQSSEVVTFKLNADVGEASDIDPTVSLANPGEESIRILRVESIKKQDAVNNVRVLRFALAGPERRESMSGGIITAKDVGTQLLVGDEAVIPPGASEDDYMMLVRYATRPPTPASDAGLRVTYAVGDQTYETTWNRRVVVCSEKGGTC